VQGARKPKKGGRSKSLAAPSEVIIQSSDPIQNSAELIEHQIGAQVQEVSDMNSFNNGSLVDGVLRHEVDSVNFRIQAERLFNIGMNLGISSNEDRILMVERLIDSVGDEQRADLEVGDVVVPQ
jgi:hypothetical protein